MERFWNLWCLGSSPSAWFHWPGMELWFWASWLVEITGLIMVLLSVLNLIKDHISFYMKFLRLFLRIVSTSFLPLLLQLFPCPSALSLIHDLFFSYCYTYRCACIHTSTHKQCTCVHKYEHKHTYGHIYSAYIFILPFFYLCHVSILLESIHIEYFKR